MILAHSIKFVASVIVHDDTGELLRLIRAITILLGLVITMVRMVTPILEWMQDIATTIQQVRLTLVTYPVLEMATG